MTKDVIRRTILDLFRQRALMEGIDEDVDFFDLGVSSLTIIDLQIAVESALETSVPTNVLMRFSTVREWIEAYSASCGPSHV
jgi:acyl carrier protein